MNRPRRPAGTAFTTPALAAVLCATTLLAGCTPPTPTPTPRPTPTWQCTPEAGGGTPKPCTEYEHREMKKKQALYEEAERVFRRHFAEDVRLQMDYRVAKMTDVIRETAAGVYLDSRESFYQDARENKTVGKPLPTIVWIKRLPGFSKEGSLAALEVCVDATKTVVTRNGKQLPEGEMFFGRFYFNRIDGRLKIANADIGKGPKC